MHIKVNGKPVELEYKMTVGEFVQDRALKGMFAIEKNLKIINKEDYSTELLQEGDSIEIVGFVGGG